MLNGDKPELRESYFSPPYLARVGWAAGRKRKCWPAPASSCPAMEESPSPAFGEPVLDARSEVTCQLIDFQWKLGMAVSSDRCRSLKYPYVAVLLKVADHSGQENSKSIEMTIPQFQNFYRQFKEIAAVIETV